MLELLFLLLPIAALYGWYMGQRSAKKEQEQLNNKFSRDYVTGLNFLLSNQQEKAVDLFLSMLQTQESKNQIAVESQFEAELTLGDLFLSRGEVDRALRIHQTLVDDVNNYSFEQKLLAKQHLAKDFMAAGFYDRAENYYISLLDEPEFANHSLSQLTVIYQKMREWKKAINVAEKLLKIAPDTDTKAISHFYCEYAQTLKDDDKTFIASLHKALAYSPNCSRASILLGEFYFQQQQFVQALVFFEAVLTQDPAYISEVITQIGQCYEQLGKRDQFELFLIKANQIKHNSSVDLALAEWIEKKDGVEAAQSRLYQQVRQFPNMVTFHRFIYYQMNEAEEGRGKESLLLLHNMVGDRIQKGFHYHCINCGYKSYRLTWHCPSCRQWEMIKPMYSTEI